MVRFSWADFAWADFAWADFAEIGNGERSSPHADFGEVRPQWHTSSLRDSLTKQVARGASCQTISRSMFS